MRNRWGHKFSRVNTIGLVGVKMKVHESANFSPAQDFYFLPSPSSPFLFNCNHEDQHRPQLSKADDKNRCGAREVLQ